MTTVLKASGSADFLRIVPVLAGFTPRRSLVLLPFRGTRTHGAMRVDLPRDDVELDEYAAGAIGVIARVEEVDAVALVVYADDDPQPTPDGLVLPQAVAVDAVLTCATDAGLRIVDALCVTPSGWSSYIDDDPKVEPLEPVAGPLEVPGVGDVSGDQLDGVTLPHIDLAEKERVGQALLDIGSVLAHESDAPLSGDQNPQALAATAMLDDMTSFFEEVLEHPDTLPTFAIAALVWCLDRPIFRDVAMLQWATDLRGGLRTLSAQLAFSHSGRIALSDVGDTFLGQGPTPDADRLGMALRVVRHVAAAAPSASRPGPLTVAAWLSWALGRSSHAGYYLDLVREIDPDYGLAELVRMMLDRAMLPEWVFRTRVPAT